MANITSEDLKSHQDILEKSFKERTKKEITENPKNKETGAIGFEPTTSGFGDQRSTVELHP